MKTTTTLSTDLLRRLALMQHLGEDYFFVKGIAYEGNEDEAKANYEEHKEDVEDASSQMSFEEFVEDTFSQVEEFDTEDYNNDYLVLTDSEADEKAEEYIKDSLWAFNSDFIINHSALPYEAKEMIKSFQRDKCEGANDTIEALIEDMDKFVSDAISADGRGHFMSSYDGEENEITVVLPESITTEMMEESDIDQKTTFYIYRIN